MMELELKGILPALVTPFRDDESLDLDALERLVDRVIAGGVHGLFVAGSQGEFYALRPDEHEELVLAAVSASASRVPVLAGASAVATADAVRLARQAERAGADAVIIMPPYYVRPSERELVSHFEAVAAAVDIPVVLYNQPQRTGIWISTALAVELAVVPNIVGIKDSSASLNQTVDYVTSCPGGFSVLVGNDEQIAYALLAGADGAIAATANVVPDVCVGIYDAVKRGDVGSARRLQTELSRLRRAFDLGTFPVVVKEAMALLGEPVGPCRRPVGPLSGEAREVLRSVLDRLTAESGLKEAIS